MYLIGLGLVSTILSSIYYLASLLDVKKEFTASVKNTMEELVTSKIDFAPIEILSSDKTTGWIGSDYIRTCKFLPYILRNVDRYIAEKNQDDINIKDYNLKRYKNYLLLRNLKVLNTIKEKREAVLKHMKSMKNEINECDKISIQLVVCSIYKLVANIMTAVDLRQSKLRIHYKQYLNSFHEMDVLVKKLTNNKLETYKIASM